MVISVQPCPRFLGLHSIEINLKQTRKDAITQALGYGLGMTELPGGRVFVGEKTGVHQKDRYYKVFVATGKTPQAGLDKWIQQTLATINPNKRIIEDLEPNSGAIATSKSQKDALPEVITRRLKQEEHQQLLAGWIAVRGKSQKKNDVLNLFNNQGQWISTINLKEIVPLQLETLADFWKRFQ